MWTRSSFQRRHDYVTVVSDLERARVLFVADDRKRESLEAFWALGLTDAQRADVEAIAMDMWEPYVQATRAQVPDADTKIVFDRFHCAKHLNEGLDRVRRAEHRDLRARGDTRLTGPSTPGCGIPITSRGRRGARSGPYAPARSGSPAPGR